MDQSHLTARDTLRYKMLRALFDAVGGAEYLFANSYEIASKIGISESEAHAVIDYLAGEGLVQRKLLNGGVVLTHQGIKEVEQSIRRPSEATHHFNPQAFAVYHQTFHGPIGVVQTGAQSVAHVTQAVSNDVRALIQNLRDCIQLLPLDQQANAHEHLEELEDQAKNTNRRRSTVQMLLATLSAIFVSAVGSGAGGVLTEIGKKLLL